MVKPFEILPKCHYSCYNKKDLFSSNLFFRICFLVCLFEDLVQESKNLLSHVKTISAVEESSGVVLVN